MKRGPNSEAFKGGYGLWHFDLTKGYRVRQRVDLANLKIPKNLGTAAVTPVTNRNSTPTSTKSEK
jgi:hypothetical protein